MTQDEEIKKERGGLIVISGPSGVGKGTVCKALMKAMPDLKISISETTRKPRGTEQNGVEYFFLEKENFEQRIKENKYLEYAKVYENYYGTPKDYVENLRNSGYDVILEIDIQGAMNVQKNNDDGVFIFIVPPSLDELEHRVRNRGTDSEEQLAIRINSARDEIKKAVNYDYVVVNDTVEEAAKKLQTIILAERCRTERSKNTLDNILGR